MPGGDRTGPMGQGARTGRGMGYCWTDGQPAFNGPYRGRRMDPGLGYRGGRGGGFRNRFCQTYPPYAGRPGFLGRGAWVEPDNEVNWLKDEISNLEANLKDARDRLNNLEAKTDTPKES